MTKKNSARKMPENMLNRNQMGEWAKCTLLPGSWGDATTNDVIDWPSAFG